jgi:hypothetical protein
MSHHFLSTKLERTIQWVSENRMIKTVIKPYFYLVSKEKWDSRVINQVGIIKIHVFNWRSHTLIFFKKNKINLASCIHTRTYICQWASSALVQWSTAYKWIGLSRTVSYMNRQSWVWPNYKWVMQMDWPDSYFNITIFFFKKKRCNVKQNYIIFSHASNG